MAVATGALAGSGASNGSGSLESATLSGTWIGQAKGTPFAMGLVFQGSSVSGMVQVLSGGEVSARNVTGTYEADSGAIRLTEDAVASPLTYKGTLADRQASGEILENGKVAGAWNARQQ